MRIAVLGTGLVGRALAARLSELGHDVCLGTRDPAATRATTDADGHLTETARWVHTHPEVPLLTFAEAADRSELAINATNGSVSLLALEATRGHLDGKVLLDVSNPLDFSGGFPPTLFVKDTDSLGEQIQAAFPDVRVVKTLNTMNASLMVHPEELSEAHTVFVSGNERAAKQDTVELLRQLGHEDILDLGDITTARGTEMYLPLWLRTMQALGTASFNVRIIR
jgi:predicted dinucleotide-binding enzyme